MLVGGRFDQSFHFSGKTVKFNTEYLLLFSVTISCIFVFFKGAICKVCLITLAYNIKQTVKKQQC